MKAEGAPCHSGAGVQEHGEHGEHSHQR